MAKLKGRNLRLSVNQKTIALSTSCSINTTTVTMDSRTKDDPVGPSAEFDYVDWTSNSENVVGMSKGDSAEIMYRHLLGHQLAGNKLAVSMDLVEADSEAATAFIACSGDAMIDSLNLNAPVDGHATLSVSLKGVSALTMSE